MLRNSKETLRQIGVASYVFNPVDLDALCTYGVAYSNLYKYQNGIRCMYKTLANEHSERRLELVAPVDGLQPTEPGLSKVGADYSFSVSADAETWTREKTTRTKRNEV